MKTTFSDVLESVESLPMDEKEMLIDIIRKRMSEERRDEIMLDIEEAERDFREGRCKTATVDEIMQEILA